MANDNTQRDRQSLFNAINEAGFDIGKYDDFNSRMDNADDRRKFYDAVSDAGYDIGGFDEFERRMVGSQDGVAEETQPVQQEKPYKTLFDMKSAGRVNEEGKTAKTVAQDNAFNQAMTRWGVPQAQKKPMSQKEASQKYMGASRNVEQARQAAKGADEAFWNGTNGRVPNYFTDVAPKVREAEVAEREREAVDKEREAVRQDYDSQNFENFYQQNVKPVFEAEKKAGEERAGADDAYNQKILESVGYDKSTAMAMAARRAVKEERETDPEKIAQNTVKAVEQGKVADYALGRMGFADVPTQEGQESAPLSDEEKMLFNELYGKEVNEVAGMMIKRMYDEYRAAGVPESDLQYILGKAVQDNVAMTLMKALTRRMAGSSGLREQFRQEAYQRYGDEASWLTKMAGSAAPFAVDVATGGFAIPSLAGKGAVKGVTSWMARNAAKKMGQRAAGQVAKNTTREMASAALNRYMQANAPVMNVMLNSLGGAANFGTYELQNEAIRQFGDGEFEPWKLLKAFGHGSALGGAMGVAGGSIGHLTKGMSAAGKVAGDVAGVAAETGIFATDRAIEKAREDGVSILDVDWADIAGESLGMVLGMKAVGGVLSPKSLAERYKKSPDYDLKLNERDTKELKDAGYDFSTIFKGMKEVGELAPLEKRQEVKFEEGGKSEAVEVDERNLKDLIDNPNISIDTKRKIVYLATGKILAPAPVGHAEMDIHEDGSATVTTYNLAGEVDGVKDYDDVRDADKYYREKRGQAYVNTIDGLQTMFERLGVPRLSEEAKSATKNQTGIDVDDVLMKRMDERTESENAALDSYIRNMQYGFSAWNNANRMRLEMDAAIREGREMRTSEDVHESEQKLLEAGAELDDATRQTLDKMWEEGVTEENSTELQDIFEKNPAAKGYFVGLGQQKGLDMQVDDEIAKAVEAESERMQPFYDEEEGGYLIPVEYKGRTGYVVDGTAGEVVVQFEDNGEKMMLGTDDADLVYGEATTIEQHMAEFEHQVSAQLRGEVENARVNNPKTNTMPKKGDVIQTKDGEQRVGLVTDDYRVLLEPNEYTIDEESGQPVPVSIKKFSGSDLISWEDFVGMQNEYYNEQDKLARDEQKAVEEEVVADEVAAEQENGVNVLNGENEVPVATEQQQPEQAEQVAEAAPVVEDVMPMNEVEENAEKSIQEVLEERQRQEEEKKLKRQREDNERMMRLLLWSENKANKFVKNNLEAIDKALKAAQKKESKSTDADVFERETEAIEAEIARLKDEKRRWETALKRANEERAAAAKEEQGMPELATKVSQLDEPFSMKEWMMRALYGGDYKFIWADSPTTKTRGLGSHLGFGDSNTEFRKRLGMLANRDKGGLYPEEVAEKLMSAYAAEMGWKGTDGDWNVSSQDMFNMMLDILREYSTRGDIGKGAVELHNHALEASRMKAQSAVNAEEEYMKDEWAKDGGFNSYAEYEDYKEMKDKSIAPFTNDEMQEIYVGIADELENSVSLQQNEELNTEENGKQGSNQGVQGRSELLPETESGEAVGGTADIGEQGRREDSSARDEGAGIVREVQGDSGEQVGEPEYNFENETEEEAMAFDQRVPQMSDAELLDVIRAQGHDENKAAHMSVYDEYDSRHTDEYLERYDYYTDQLGGLSREQVEAMLMSAEKEWRDGGFATDERTALSAQIDAYTEWLNAHDVEGEPLNEYDPVRRAEQVVEREEKKNEVKAVTPERKLAIDKKRSELKKKRSKLSSKALGLGFIDKKTPMAEIGKINKQLDKLLKEKYSDKWGEIENALADVNDDPRAVGFAIGQMVDSVSEGHEMLNFAKDVNNESMARFYEGVENGFEEETPLFREDDDFEERQKKAVEDVGTVMPNLADVEVTIVDVPKHDFEGTGKDVLKKAENWAKENLVGTYKATGHNGVTFDYDIRNKSIEKYVSSSSVKNSDNLGVHLAVLKKLPDVISNSIEAEVHPDYKKGDNGVRDAINPVNDKSLIHRFYGAVSIDGKVYKVKTTIREFGNKGVNAKAHNYEVTKIELIEAPSTYDSKANHEPSAMTSASSISGAKLLKGVEKSYEKGKYLLNESKKVSKDGENNRTLMGVHNISEEKLRKALKLGGLANPSMAVLDTDNYTHTDFGEISLIPRSSLIDSRTGRNAGTFTADAWTPTYPQVQKRMTDKGQSQFWKDMHILDDEPRELYSKTRMAFDSWLDGNNTPERLAFWFLKEKGIEPERVHYDSGISAEDKKAFKDIVGDRERDFYELTTEEREKVLPLIAKSRGETVEEMLDKFQQLKKRNQESLESDPKFKVIKQRAIEAIDEYGITLGAARDYFDKMRSAFRYDGTINDNATISAAVEQVKKQGLEKEFDQWIADKEKKYGIEEWLWNGTDYQDRDRWLRNTLENASKLMKRQGLNGAKNWSSIGNWIAKVANKEKTLEGIRKYKGNLSKSLEEHNAFEDKWTEILHDIALKIAYNGDILSGEDRMSDALEHKNPADYIKKEYGVDLSKEDRQMLDTFIKEVRENFPTGYFETKFERPVGLDEFAVAVVPETTSSDVVEALRNAGLDVRTYNNEGTEEENNEARRAVVMDAVEDRDDILFRDAEDIFVSNAERAVEGIKQEKATPEQWLKMIEKAGGLKAGEDKWMGLSDWLKENKSKTLTKDEVLDYIRQNKIEIYDETYAGAADVDNNEKMQEFRDEFDKLVSKYRNEKDNVEEEANAFNDEMYEKYGQGWANDPDRMSEEDQKRNDDITERWHRLNDNSVEELAFADMVDNYGDDFSDAFDIDLGGGKLEPAYDWDGSLMDAARYFLDINDKPINETRLNYTTNGLDNKKEIALVVPSVEPYNESDEVHFGDAGEGRAVAWVRFGETEIPRKDPEAQKKFDEAQNEWDDFSNAMYDKYGAIYSTKLSPEEAKENRRLMDNWSAAKEELATANSPERVLVIDEIQSKRHQDGREKGYESEFADSPKGKYDETYEKLTAYRKELEKKYGENFLSDDMTEEERTKYNEMYDNMVALSEYKDDKIYNVPDAPFDKNWHELAMKRMLRYAAENGYDKVAWTKGEQQAERYSLGKVFNSIEREDNPSQEGKRFVFSGANVDVMRVDDEGKVISSTIGEADGKKLSDLVGKDLAGKMMSMENGDMLDSEELRIGGEGMKGFYDQILPRFINKYGKKWGVQVGEVTLPRLEDSAQKMWSVDVTPEMRGDVMDGQVMFREVGDKKTLEQLEKEPKVKVYRAMQLIDGELYPPMSAKENGKLRQPSKLGVWEEAEERPDLADENGYFKLDKGNGKSLKARYNPYFHTSRTMLNDQFSEAQNRDNLVVVEMEVPVSELTSGYQADKAKDSVGVKQWKAGMIQGQLSGTREVILSRWAKPVRIVPNEEVAENIARQIRGQVDVMPTNVVTPQVREEMEKQGVKFVKTDNRGVIQEGENAGKTWASVYGRKKGMRMREGDDVATPTQQARPSRGRYTKRQIERANRKATEKFYNTVERMGISDRVHVYESGQAYLESLGKKNPTSVDMRKARSKGWFDPKTKQIYIIVANNRGLNDTMATLLHEGVTHYGLRELVGEERFDQFIDDVYDNAVDEIQEKIDALAERLKEKDNGRREDKQYQRVATEEYMAKLAEEMDFDNDSPSGWKATLKAWWNQIKESFFKMMHKLGLGTYDGAWLTDNELRYILWRSWKNLTEPGAYKNPWNVEARAEDRAMQDKLKVGEYAEDYHGLINSKDVVAVNRKPTMLDGYTKGIGVEIDMTKGRHLNLFVNPMSGEVQVMSGTRGFTNGQRMRMEGEYLDNILGQRIANDIMENAGAGETKLQPMETTAQKQEAQPVAKAAESNEQVNKAINAIRTEGTDFMSNEMKTKVLDAYNMVHDKVPDAMAIVQTPYGYVMINKDAKVVRNLFNLEDNPYVVFPEDKMSDVLPVLIRAGHRVAVAETSNNKAAESGVVKEGEDVLDAYDPIKRAQQTEDKKAKVNEAVSAFNDMQKRYNGKNFDAVVYEDMSDDDLLDMASWDKESRDELKNDIDDMREYFENKKILAFHHPFTGKITIFADRIKPEMLEETFFHENIHGIFKDIYGDELRDVAEHFWDVAPDEGLVSRSHITDSKIYDKEVWKEELLTYWLGRAMVQGRVGEVLDMLGDEDKAVVNNILNTIGYDRTKEEQRRISTQENVGLGETERSDGSVYRPSDGAVGRETEAEVEETPLFREDEDEPVEPRNFRNIMTKAVLDVARSNKENSQKKSDAIRRVIDELKSKMERLRGGSNESPVAAGAVRSAVRAQKAYDQSTVKDLVEFAKVVMDAGMMDAASKGELKRMLNLVKGATGKDDLQNSVNAVADLLIDHTLKESKELLNKQLSTKGKKVDAKGVEVQGVLDVEGQRVLKALKEGMQLDEDSLNQRLAEAMDKMGSEDDAVAGNAASEYEGLMLAQQYMENIKKSEAEERNIKHELQVMKDGLKEGETDRDSYKQFLAEVEETVRQNKMERIDAYQQLISSIGGGLAQSFERAKAFKENEVNRVRAIQHNANSDLEGIPATTQNKLPWTKKLANNNLVRFFMQPVATFDEMLTYLGKKSPDGRGYLWNRFMTQWTESADKEWKNLYAAHKELDAKVHEIFPELKRWSDLFTLERKMPTADLTYWDADGQHTYKLTAGNLLYIYMVNKMSDGRMKLRRMGIDEEKVQEIKDSLDPRLIELADWIQDEFLVNKRNDYNAVHKRMFGADMASIDNYFPLKIDKKALPKNEDLSAYESGAETPSTITGSVIKRKKNTASLDLVNADAFDVVLDHLQQMEHWAAFAEFNRDLSTLLSYKRFNNQLRNMSSARFGAGDTLLDNFKKVAAIAGGAYRPKVNNDSVDKTIVNIAKGVTAAKIAIRVYTAFKQLLSYPAYLSEANLMELAKSSTPWGAYQACNWAMENLPLFAERWQSRQAGDTRLQETDSDWDVWKTAVVKAAARWGMTPNAAVDALTVAMGAKAVYETALKRYKKDGFDDATAEQKALRDAAIAYNETQQSSQGAFVSAVQLDRTAAAAAISVFRNASMAYQRRMLRALAQMKYRAQSDKEDSIAFTEKLLGREGLDEEQAEKAAKRIYQRNIWRNLADVAIFGYVLQWFWNLAPYLPYLLAGDDDDEKQKMLEDVSLHSLLGGIEGLSGGNYLSEALNYGRQTLMAENDAELNKVKQKARYQDMNLLPLLSDVKDLMDKTLQGDGAAFDMGFNLIMQSAVGVNPQTIADGITAVIDAFNGDMGMFKEFAFAFARIMQAPSSSMDMLYIDELGMFAHDARKLSMEQMAKRWAKYKFRKERPYTGWLLSEEAKKEKEDKLIKRFEDKVKERISDMDDKEVEKMLIQSRSGMEQQMLEKEMKKRYDAKAEELEGDELNKAFDEAELLMERKRLAKQIAKNAGASSDPYGDTTDKFHEQQYQSLRNAQDVLEDALLLKLQEDAKDAGDEERKKLISKERSDVMSARKGLGQGQDEEVMKMIRENRRKLIEQFQISE